MSADLVKVASVHHEALKSFLSTLPVNEAAINSQRQIARDKLLRLTDNQFHELSTDVYDELVRRQKDPQEAPFLEVRAEFHQKRNQARQKLATLSKNRFRDLASDVSYELDRRYGDIFNENVRKNGAGSSTSVSKSAQVQRSASFDQAASEKLFPKLDMMLLGDVTTNNTSASGRSLSLAAATPPAQSSTATSQDVLGMVNFTSLDNLMADLGNMIATSIDGDGLSANSPAPPEKDAPGARSPAGTFVTAPTPPGPNQSPASSIGRSGGAAIADNNSVSSQSSLLQSPQQQLQQQAQSQSQKQTSPPRQYQQGSPQASDYSSTSSLRRQVPEHQQQQQQQQQLVNGSDRDQSSYEITQLQATILDLKRDVDAANTAKKRQVDQLQQQHDTQIKSMQQQIRQLQADLEDRDVDKYLRQIADLESELEKRDSESDRQLELVQKLNKEKNELQATLESERAVQTQLRAEAGEATRLMILNQRMQAEKQEMEGRIARTEAELTAAREKFAAAEYGWKLQLEARAQSEEARGKSDEIDLNARANWDSAGMLGAADVLQFREAVRELKAASQTDDRAAVLTAMKAIVLSTRNISERISQFDSGGNTSSAATGPISGPDREKMARTRSDLSTNLTDLMTAAKNHATGINTKDGSLNAAANALTSNIGQIVGLAKIALTAASMMVPSAGDSPSRSAQQPQSQSQKQSPSMARQALKDPAVDEYAPDEVKAFLEAQTDLIVQNIHTLLQAMRESVFNDEFRNTINNITSVVSNLVRVSQRTLADPAATSAQKDRGAEILQNLTVSNGRLGELGHVFVKDSAQQRPGKQKLAAAAYEVAKFTKELVGLFDMDK